eukprot:SAG31_NODE_9759_length_1231_cov_1.589223_1_plen_170_part_10
MIHLACQDEAEYDPWRHYGQSKLANALFAYELNRRLSKTGVTAAACHPGWVASRLFKHLSDPSVGMPILGLPLPGFLVDIAISILALTPKNGALTPLFLAVADTTDPSTEAPTGFFYPIARKGSPTNDLATDPALAKRLWSVSEKLVSAALGTAEEPIVYKKSSKADGRR